ncbi:MAG TPA: glycosyltransferase family 87 protein, partial [Rhizomicrobium sp.]|nr:glycosyltransferase family 87 protein [Rhizomicrobium sp.]
MNEWFERAFVYLGASTAVQRRFLVLSAAIALGYLEWFVILSWSTHGFVLDHSGHPVPRDFLAFWTAGRDALNGSAPLAYKPNWMHAAEVTAVGHGFIGDLRWRYPPAFFLVAAALSVLPYETAFLIWICTTAFAYALAASRAARYRGAFLIALAAPWTFINIFLGQNGFLSASILGFALLQLRLRPALGGAILGLLIYKPQFGLLIPFALGAGGHWRAFGSAAIVALVSNVIAAFLFGPETLSAFAHETTEFATTMSVPGIHFSFQSLYAVLHD